ncbi:MAG TPA: aminotransferase class IV [bacterium]|nr:aminotransferase class IV [bacterium]
MMAEPMRAARYVHWDGRVVPVDEARVSILDTGFLYGDGVYDTMRAYGGRVFALDRHLARLERSSERVGMRVPGAADLSRRIDELLVANETADAVLRITATRGRLARRLDLSSATQPSIAITLDFIDPGADEARRAGIRVAYSRYVRTTRHPLAGVKSTSYQVSLLARNEARELGATEVLLANESGEICEGAAANVFFVENDTLFTPALSTGILGGITREVALECARARHLPIQESTFSKERLERASEVFMTGTTIQIAAVIAVGSTSLGGGRPGPIARLLLDDYLSKVRQQTGSPAHGVRG